MMTSEAAGPWEICEADYHADFSRVSHHMLEQFRLSIPKYAGLYVTGTIPRPEPTAAMRFGSALHCLVLEPERFTAAYGVLPEGINLRTNRGKAERDNMLAAGLRVIGADDALTLAAMREAVYADCLARAALEAEGVVEQPIRWTGAIGPMGVHDGPALKAKPDKVLTSGLILDLKTISDEGRGSPKPRLDGWAWACAGFGYHRQAAYYLEGAWACYQADGPVLFVAVGKEPPHEVSCHEIHPDDLAAAAARNRELLMELAGRMSSGDWSAREAGKVHVTRVPPWGQK